MGGFLDYFKAVEMRIFGQFAHVAQSVEHVLGKDGVTGSNPVVGSYLGLRNTTAACAIRVR